MSLSVTSHCLSCVCIVSISSHHVSVSCLTSATRGPGNSGWRTGERDSCYTGDNALNLCCKLCLIFLISSLPQLSNPRLARFISQKTDRLFREEVGDRQAVQGRLVRDQVLAPRSLQLQLLASSSSSSSSLLCRWRSTPPCCPPSRLSLRYTRTIGVWCQVYSAICLNWEIPIFSISSFHCIHGLPTVHFCRCRHFFEAVLQGDTIFCRSPPPLLVLHINHTDYAG